MWPAINWAAFIANTKTRPWNGWCTGCVIVMPVVSSIDWSCALRSGICARGGLLWYAPDQDYRRGENLFIPFFGVQASTSTSPHQLARMGKAKVLLMSQRRLPGNKGYEVIFQPAFDNMPADEPAQDLRRINQALEVVIRDCPEQYLWIHRRFKTRPEGEQSVY